MARKYKLITVLVLLVVLVSVSFLNNAWQVKTQTISQEAAEDFIGYKLPENVSEMKFLIQGGMDNVLFMRFDTTPDSANEFIKNIGVELPLTNDYLDAVVSPINKVEWWMPKKENAVSGSSYSDPRFQVIEQTNTVDSVTVYLTAF